MPRGTTINYESNANARQEGNVKKGYWVVAYRSISDASAVKAYGVTGAATLRRRMFSNSTTKEKAMAKYT